MAEGFAFGILDNKQNLIAGAVSDYVLLYKPVIIVLYGNGLFNPINVYRMAFKGISTIYILKGKAAVFRKRIREISIVVYNYNVVSVKADGCDNVLIGLLGNVEINLYNGQVFVYPRNNGSRRASVAQLVCKFKGKFAVIVEGKRIVRVIRYGYVGLIE